MKELEEYVQQDAAQTYQLYVQRKLNRRYQRAKRRMTIRFIVACMLVMLISAIASNTIIQKNAAEAEIIANAVPPTITVVETPEPAPTPVETPMDEVGTAAASVHYCFPVTSQGAALDKVPALLTEKREQIDYTYDSSIPLSASLQYWISGLCYDYGIDPYLVYAVIERETQYGKATISSDGQDFGMMQIRKINHDWINKAFATTLDFNDDYDNTMAGIYMLNQLITKYSSKGVNYVLMCYNMGEGGAQTAWSNGATSSSYSRDVMNTYNKLKGE